MYTNYKTAKEAVADVKFDNRLKADVRIIDAIVYDRRQIISMGLWSSQDVIGDQNDLIQNMK